MSNSSTFTCYFCNEIIKNESEKGHNTLCSKVLVPCPLKCGAYITRESLAKHQTKCVNQSRTSTNGLTTLPRSSQASANGTNSLGKNVASKSQVQIELSKIHQRFSELEERLKLQQSRKEQNDNYVSNTSFNEIRFKLDQQANAIQKINYHNGYINEWKKQIESQLTSIRSTLTTMENINKEASKSWNRIQEKLIVLQNLQMDLNVFKESVYKDNTHFKNTEMDFARNIEELKNYLKEQDCTLANLWSDQSRALEGALNEIESTKKALDEQKAKQAALLFDLRAVSQISSEAAEKTEIQEREYKVLHKEVNQLKVNLEILENLVNSEGDANLGGIVWRITDFDLQLKRAKENDTFLKSPTFYTHRYGYKVKVFLYLNGLKKWKDRYALACIHVLKGEYDMLLPWPCAIEGNIILRDVTNPLNPKNFTKFIKTKKFCGDEEEDEPQESSSTYIFIPHNVLLKENYLKDDTVFLEVKMNSNPRRETSL